MTDANTIREQQQDLWNGTSGKAWVDAQSIMDAMFEQAAHHLAGFVAAQTPKNVLDVGCGTGAVTLAAANAIEDGGACTGIDISQPMLALARERAAQQDANATFINADAETHDFGDQKFDTIISRFGVMFFGDPVAAFRNLRSATAPSAKMCVLAWRAPDENPFMTTGTRAAREFLPDMPRRDTSGPGQFGFADKAFVTDILEQSGWKYIEIMPLDIDCAFPASELDKFLTRLGPLGQLLKDEDPARRDEIMRSVKDAYSHFIDGDTVRYTAACWQIVASNA
ncbi:class I SAM-dependent methyltransferase [Henriciella litoralis]|uniref:class I SAM-dependent methyltransferase n=1 Tax=Henriciella litoralis TaxID=568102 RepID=UPI000A00CD4E|nr:methyltransferase domain-containing protein [Henriciella litoralis]